MIEVERSVETPPSLAREVEGCWRALDVLEALHADFAGKCYLCERKHPLPTYEVDHRRPRSAFAAHWYSWANLFPVCEGCNKRRPKRWPAGGLLSPGQFDGVEDRVHQYAELDEDDGLVPQFVARHPHDRAAENTADELRHLHDDDVTRQSASAAIKGRDLRSAIHRRLTQVLVEACRYQRLLRVEPASVERRLSEDRLRRLLSRRAPYTALVRSRFVDQPAIVALFD